MAVSTDTTGFTTGFLFAKRGFIAEKIGSSDQSNTTSTLAGAIVAAPEWVTLKH